MLTNIDRSNEIKQIIAKIMDEQEQPNETGLKNLLLYSNDKKVDKVYENTIFPIYQALQILYSEKKIDTNQYTERLTSLIKLCKLLEDVVTKEAKNEHS